MENSTKAAREPAIHHHFHILESSLVRIKDALENLEEKLNPVLNPQVTSPQAVKDEVEQLAPLADNLRALNEKALSIEELIEGIKNRTEL